MLSSESDRRVALQWVVRALALARLATTRPEIPDGLAVAAEKSARELEAICDLWDGIIENVVNWQASTFAGDHIHKAAWASLKSQECDTRGATLDVLSEMCAQKLRELTSHLTVARQELGSRLPLSEWPSAVKGVFYNGS